MTVILELTSTRTSELEEGVIPIEDLKGLDLKGCSCSAGDDQPYN
ncbi:hypothetical protein GCM10022223_61150 [Kineosporia mesophila]|uniref:Uncharacterized protein n=1 Tax=Kineosporia mesophila TaxID=566012 RepID=A0ABP7AL20_9ACTN|nr:hypothetical protein [Kineosporia mesophila]